MLKHDAPTNEHSLKEGYEVTDMNVRIISVSLAFLLLLMFGACAVIVMVIRGFNESRAPLNKDAASALATPQSQVPVEPHLQGVEVVEDRKRIQAENIVKVTTYGVLSEEAGMERVHIPVVRAMELLAEGKGVYRQAPTVASEAPAAAPAEAPAAAPAPAQP